MSTKILAKKPPFYQYKEGWLVDTKKNDPEVGVIRIYHRWYKNYNEAKADFQNQYQMAKEKAQGKKNRHPKQDETLRFGKFIEIFSDYRLTKVRGSTFYHLDKFIQRNFLEEHYNKPIKDVFNRDFASEFKNLVLKKNLTKAYKNKALGYYRQMCEYAFGSGMLPPDQYAYCKFATEPIAREEDKPIATKEVFTITDNEVARLLSVIDNPVYLMLTKFLFATGFRLSEALALTPKEIDFDSLKISREYVWQVNEYGSDGRHHRTKNNNEAKVPVSESIINELWRYVNELRIADDEMLFPCATDPHRPVEPQWYRKKLHGYCKQAGIREIHPHIARHTFCSKVASVMGNSDMDKKTLEILTGHTASVNQSIYTHAEDESIRQIVDNIGRRN